MKKKALTGILVASMLGMMLTGCGDNKEVTKTDETQVEITTEKESINRNFSSIYVRNDAHRLWRQQRSDKDRRNTG